MPLGAGPGAGLLSTHKMETLERLFLTEEPLTRFMIYACQRGGADPVIDTLYAMLNNDAQFVVGRYGLLLFKDLPVLPWVYMDVEQRECLYQLVFHANDRQHSAYAVLEDPLTFKAENGHIAFTGRIRLSGERIFAALLRAMAACKRPSRMLCNIILQKLGVRMVISKQLLCFINDNAKALAD